MNGKEMVKGRFIVVNSEKLEARVAILNNGKLEEYQLERKYDDNPVGSVYVGRIDRIEPALRAVFVDIGLERNAFMHYSDLVPATYEHFESIDETAPSDAASVSEELPDDVDDTEPGDPDLPETLTDEDGERVEPPAPERQHEHRGERRGDRGGRGRGRGRPRPSVRNEDIPKLFPRGSEVLVQVTKGAIGTKGSRCTTNISIPGRYLVLLPNASHIGISKKIDDRKERDRLKKILRTLPLPKGTGCICRTVGEGRKAVFFQNDINMLLESWRKIEEARKKRRGPGLVYKEPNLVERSIRDFLTEEIDSVVIDDKDDYEYLREFVARVAGQKMSEMIKLYQKASPIFEFYRIEEQISGIFQRQARLPSGGYICFDETEALIAIDVNSGGSRNAANKSELILATNLEASDEIARQLRLRNVGGLVVIDFIDMNTMKDRDKVNKRMRKQLENDRAKTRVLPISNLGLMEMTRQRENESLRDTVYDDCPYCKGTGRIKSALTVSVELQRALKELLRRKRWDKNLSVRVIVHPSVLARLKNEDDRFLRELEDEYGKDLSFRSDPAMRHDEFKLIDPKTEFEFPL